MRSVHAPRVPHDATVELASGKVARAINLSVGGIFVAADAPLDPGAHIRMKVNLLDGGAPVAVDGEVVWRADHGMALRFIGLDDAARLRIQQLVKKRENTVVSRRDVRIHLPSLSAPLRASARDLSERGIMVEAELPWLRLGSPVTTELSPDRAADGRVQWIGLDVTRAGAARLRIFVDLAEPVAGDPMLNLPPKEVLESLGGFIPAVQGPRSLFRWLWPTVAMASLLALAGVTMALLRRPPVPVLLPSTPPEREAPIAHVPPRTVVAPEKPDDTATATATATGSAPPAALIGAPAAQVTAPPAQVQPPQSQKQPAHKLRAKARPKKRGTVTRRAG